MSGYPVPNSVQNPQSPSIFGDTSVLALVEIVRLLVNIDKKLYVIIKKLEGQTENDSSSRKEPYAEDLGYDGE